MSIQFQLFSFNTIFDCLQATNIVSLLSRTASFFMLFYYNSGVKRALVTFIAKVNGMASKKYLVGSALKPLSFLLTPILPFPSSNSICHTHPSCKMSVHPLPPVIIPFTTVLLFLQILINTSCSITAEGK